MTSCRNCKQKRLQRNSTSGRYRNSIPAIESKKMSIELPVRPLTIKDVRDLCDMTERMCGLPSRHLYLGIDAYAQLTAEMKNYTPLKKLYAGTDIALPDCIIDSAKEEIFGMKIHVDINLPRNWITITPGEN